MTDAQDYDDALDQLIRNAVAALTTGRHIVTRWILIYEIADADGRLPLTANSAGTTLTDKAGLLRWATVDTDRAIENVLTLIEQGPT